MRNDNAELIQSILEGDDAAFTCLVKKYQKRVHALAWRKIGDFHIAEDITQETFLQVYRKLATLKNPNQFPGWLYVITNHCCLAWLRKKRIQTQPLEEIGITMIEKTSYSKHVAEEQAENAAEAKRELVKNLLSKLKESDRTVITLYYFGEMTYAEIGEFLGVSADTVRIRVRRAREHLKKYELLIQEALDIATERTNHFYNHLNGDFGMQLTFEKDNLLSSLRVLEGVATRQDTAHILSNVLI